MTLSRESNCLSTWQSTLTWPPRQRKTKELAQLGERIAAKERHLANENFVARAPAAVIEKERAALAELKELKAATEAALAALAKAKA